MGMLLPAIRDDLYRKLDIEIPGTAPAYIKEDVATAINQAMQTLMLAGPQFFTESTMEIALTAGVSSYAITAGLQRISGPVHIGTVPLREIETRGGWIGAADYYGNTTGQTRFYYLDVTRAVAAESVQVTLQLYPAPAANADLTVQVVLEPPAYTGASFCLDPLPVLPVAHQYVETLFLPLARYFITRSHWFSNKDLLPLLEADYEKARVDLGLASPAPVKRQPSVVEEAKP